MFGVPGMEIDFGGVVKEYAADRAATLCAEGGFRHGLVDLGGDIKIVGPHPDGTPWVVGIQHPRNPEAVMATLDLFHGAIATSAITSASSDRRPSLQPYCLPRPAFRSRPRVVSVRT